MIESNIINVYMASFVAAYNCQCKINVIIDDICNFYKLHNDNETAEYNLDLITIGYINFISLMNKYTDNINVLVVLYNFVDDTGKNNIKSAINTYNQYRQNFYMCKKRILCTAQNAGTEWNIACVKPEIYRILHSEEIDFISSNW
jgi:hypothetical protein